MCCILRAMVVDYFLLFAISDVNSVVSAIVVIIDVIATARELSTPVLGSVFCMAVPSLSTTLLLFEFAESLV